MTRQGSRQDQPGVSPLIVALVLIALSLALIVVWMALHQRPAAAPVAASETALPDRRLTPGAIDPAVSDDTICAHDWASGDPPTEGGDLTYSKAARHTSSAVKNEVFDAYHLVNPHDGGRSFEVDHLVPLSLGGRDVAENLWPESRIGDGMNAWAKDRLEYRLYRLVCDPPPGEARLPLATAQTALRTDWVAAYHAYCPDDSTCPAFGGE